MIRCWMAAVAVVFAVSSVPAADASLTEGNWRLSQLNSAVSETRPCLLKIEKKDGKLSASIADTLLLPAPKGKDRQKLPVKLTTFTAEGDKVHIEVEIRESKWTFDGTLDSKDPKIVLGSFGNDRSVSRGTLTLQSEDKLEAATAAEQPKAPEPYAEAMKLLNAGPQLQFRAFQSKDVNEKADLQAQAKEARKVAEEKTPGLFKETFDKHADSPYAVEAALRLTRLALKTKASAQDIAHWLKLIEADAVKYGPRFARETDLQMAETLVVQKGFEATALPSATRAAGGLGEKATLAEQARALKPFVVALKAGGKTDEAKASETRLAKVDASLDDEYVKTVPPFKPEKFTGRKDKDANRVVVMELFTGAQCPPCVAADVAFDALEKSYDHKDLVLIQYHMHIPGPDPLTNADTVSRWDYYSEKFPKGITGTPSTLFNGKTFDKYDTDPRHGGGGPMANAEAKFGQFKKIIDQLLEEKSETKIDGSAKVAGDKVSVDVSVDGVKEPGDKIKLRVLLLEESIKYVGSNGLRFHHQVVRSAPAPVALKEKSLKKTVEIDLADLKKGLVKYLDEYAEKERLFPNTDRPMDLKHLKVVALVQDDESGEVLNAVQLDVK